MRTANCDTHISFYLRRGKIYIYVQALRGIGMPENVCFLISPDGNTLALTAYQKKDQKSHRIPKRVYMGEKGMTISSCSLCRIISELHNWDMDASYKVPGKIYPDQDIVLFYFKEAVKI